MSEPNRWWYLEMVNDYIFGEVKAIDDLEALCSYIRVNFQILVKHFEPLGYRKTKSELQRREDKRGREVIELMRKASQSALKA